MDDSSRRRSTVLKSMDMMCEQLNQGVKGVAETIADYMQLTGFVEGEEAIVNMTIDEAFSKMENQKIVLIQQNLGIYTETAEAETKKFYIWLNARLEKLRTEEWTSEQFFESWYKAYDGITKKIQDQKTPGMDRIGIVNIISMINEIKL